MWWDESNLRNALVEWLGNGSNGGVGRVVDDLNLFDTISIAQAKDINCTRITFMGRPSTRRPLSSFAALAAVSGLRKMIEAMPRLVPFWL